LPADGFVGHTIRHAGDGVPGESGRVLDSGTSTVLGSWDSNATGYRAEITWAAPGSTDIVVDAKEASLRGFSAQFTAITGGNPSDPYGDWAGGPFAATLTDDSPALDFDGGGLPTGIEWVVGGDPTDGSDDAGLAPTFDNSAPNDLLFVFRRADAAEADVNSAIAVEYGGDLTSWRNTIDHGPADGVITNVADDHHGPGIDRVTVAIPRSLEADGALFARLKVTIAEP
jgi:hypothetical protein